MIKTMVLMIGLFCAVPLGVAGAQAVNQGGTTNQGVRAVPGNQGLIGTNRQPLPQGENQRLQSRLCGAGGQSVRVCENDFQSCNSACAGTQLADVFGFEGCTQRCCNNLRSCLSLRGCATLTETDCFSPLSPQVRGLRGAAQ
jgi:hypothetical protein